MPVNRLLSVVPFLPLPIGFSDSTGTCISAKKYILRDNGGKVSFDRLPNRNSPPVFSYVAETHL